MAISYWHATNQAIWDSESLPFGYVNCGVFGTDRCVSELVKDASVASRHFSVNHANGKCFRRDLIISHL